MYDVLCGLMEKAIGPSYRVYCPLKNVFSATHLSMVVEPTVKALWWRHTHSSDNSHLEIVVIFFLFLSRECYGCFQTIIIERDVRDFYLWDVQITALKLLSVLRGMLDCQRKNGTKRSAVNYPLLLFSAHLLVNTPHNRHKQKKSWRKSEHGGAPL